VHSNNDVVQQSCKIVAALIFIWIHIKPRVVKIRCNAIKQNVFGYRSGYMCNKRCNLFYLIAHVIRALVELSEVWDRFCSYTQSTVMKVWTLSFTMLSINRATSPSTRRLDLSLSSVDLTAALRQNMSSKSLQTAHMSEVLAVLTQNDHIF